MRFSTVLLILIGFIIGLFAGMREVIAVPSPSQYCHQMYLIDTAPQALSAEEISRTDQIVVSKSRKKLYLLNLGKIVKVYEVSFGFGYENGHKMREGDGRTPEGLYKINRKNPKSKYHLALGVSYPNKADVERARKLKVKPGGDIMIHGLPHAGLGGLVPEFIQHLHQQIHWTQGCIAVTNEEIEEIYLLVREETPIEICPLSSL